MSKNCHFDNFVAKAVKQILISEIFSEIEKIFGHQKPAFGDHFDRQNQSFGDHQKWSFSDQNDPLWGDEKTHHGEWGFGGASIPVMSFSSP